ncbi:tRNA lysidine(34) synthetase TilS [Dyadobacter alkalitolerans]|uniref:tRNA lysidine(34) synthetase TilS n=1 Tax=Dyadobacter alkalitolerans TaxID=492736 RepID=UPI000422D77C|nr:tRNA lysidine(34) synthetase TilS [Dyadobacter alkalitolerans]
MLDAFLTFINQHKLDLEKQPCLLTVSGGVDSVVMLHLFHQAGFPAGVTHCNFELRGEESDEDEQFVQQLSQAYDFPFFTKHFDVKSFAKEKGISTQMAARDLRYEWFETLRITNGYTYIATGHHANDSLETTLLNLTRGTGLSGLHGISGINNHLIRPLLLATKDQILTYAQENALTWREDRSNASDDYKRNLIRHKVVPVLQQLNPSLEATFIHSSAKLSSADRLLKEMLDEWARGVVVTEGEQVRISKAKIVCESEPGYRLWHLLDKFGFSYQQSVQIVANLHGISGRKYLSQSHILLIDRQDLILAKMDGNPEDLSLYINEKVGEFRWEGFSLRLVQRERNSNLPTYYSSNTAILNAKKLKFPLTVRRWQKGDFFQPLGMQGKKKKLSDFFTDIKADYFTKQHTFLLINGNGEIIWVMGLRLDERYRIRDDTADILEVSWVVNSGI